MIDFEFGCSTRPRGKAFCEIEPITASIIGASAIQGGSSILSGIFGAKGAASAGRKADNIAVLQIQAAERAERRARASLAPFREAGVEATQTLRDVFLGGPGAESLDRFVRESPVTETLLDFGTERINRDLAARGLFGSGAGLETLADFKRKVLVDVTGQFLGGVSNLAALGENAAALTGNAALATGGTAANAFGQQGQIESNAALARGKAFGNAAIGVGNAGVSAASSLLNMRLFNDLVKRLGPTNSTTLDTTATTIPTSSVVNRRVGNFSLPSLSLTGA